MIATLDPNARLAMSAVNSQGLFLQFDSLKIIRHTTNTNGCETYVFQVTIPANSARLPLDVKNWVGLAVPGIWGWVWEGLIAQPGATMIVRDGEQITWEYTAWGLQNVAKKTIPNILSGLGKSLHFPDGSGTPGTPVQLASDACLLGAFCTNVGTPGQAAIVGTTAVTIGQRVNLVTNLPVSSWWDTILQYGDGTTRFDWSVWINRFWGLVPGALRAEVHFEVRDMDPYYTVDYGNLTTETKIAWSLDQIWDQAVFKYQTEPGAAQPELTQTYVPPTAPPFVHWPPGAGSAAPMILTYFGDLGQPADGDTPQSGQVAARAEALYNAQLAFRLSATSPSVQPGGLLLADGVTPVPNEAARAGRCVRVRGLPLLVQGVNYLDLFITQTSCDDQTGIVTLTPQSPSDAKSNWALQFRRPGSASITNGWTVA